jgi:YegS/Rv2252/BmrU family lipid kinase
MTDRVVAIVNPSTRGQLARLVATLEAARPPGVELDVRLTTKPGQAIELARAAARDVSIVVAVGGDGTVAEVATGLAGTSALLGIVPVGSTNITAQELGIPAQRERAAALVFGPHQVRAIDAGWCGDRRFLHIAGAGLDSHFFERTSRALKRRVGWLAYLPAALIALRQPPGRFTIDVDGERALTVRSALVLVANGGSIITPMIRLHPDVRTDDGWLDVLVFTATEPAAIGRAIWGLATRSLASSPYMVHMRGRSVRLSSDPILPVQLDGDVVTRTPVEFTIEPGAIRAIVPAR